MPCCIGELGRNSQSSGLKLGQHLFGSSDRTHLDPKSQDLAALEDCVANFIWLKTSCDCRSWPVDASRLRHAGLVESQRVIFQDWAVVGSSGFCAVGFIGFSFGGHVGIDVEILRSIRVMMDSAAGVFKPTAFDVVGSWHASSAVLNWLFLAGTQSCTKIH